MDSLQTRSTSPPRPMRRLIPDRPARPGVATILKALVVQLRPAQWVKNFACLAGLIFSGQLFQLGAVLSALVGFAAYCFASSSIYILNDYFDREKDRLNPRTASRPLASGALPVGVAAVAFVGLLVGAGTLAASLGTACLAILGTYVLMNGLYTVSIKKIVIADVMCIALGFVFRVMIGVYAVGARPTPWIVLCMFFLALFLGFAKRKSELMVTQGAANKSRAVLAKYGAAYLDTLLTMTSTMAILCYAMFTVASKKNPSLVVTIVPVVYCVFRYMLQVQMHDRGESPNKLLLQDRRLWVGICSWLIIYVTIDYGHIRIFESM